MGEVLGGHFVKESLGLLHIAAHVSQVKGIPAALFSRAATKFKSPPPIRLKISSQMVNHPLASTYSSRISTDIPLYESPGASFDQYLENKPRVFRAMFPDKQRSRRLSEVWLSML